MLLWSRPSPTGVIPNLAIGAGSRGGHPWRPSQVSAIPRLPLLVKGAPSRLRPLWNPSPQIPHLPLPRPLSSPRAGSPRHHRCVVVTTTNELSAAGEPTRSPASFVHTVLARKLEPRRSSSPDRASSPVSVAAVSPRRSAPPVLPEPLRPVPGLPENTIRPLMMESRSQRIPRMILRGVRLPGVV
ncbi:translation initiation factor IF-2 [Triticum aestivum]|uniref:translation initiation factor IF-2 n=1 Tax=Triticum aestivum TaxID=4565 RepID=UPI001D01FC8E|nr:translation initiation factor IF-2-like [Triticum aestivum]